jgi:two-component system, chemotaxis family, chemotaxis protein CheY
VAYWLSATEFFYFELNEEIIYQVSLRLGYIAFFLVIGWGQRIISATGAKLMRALVVEDDTMVAKIFGMVIKPLFQEIDYAVNGDEGFAAYKRSVSDERPYDVIFLDIMMPLVTGLEMLEMVRNDERERSVLTEKPEKEVMIFMLTALDDHATMDKAYRLGCNDYLKKPANRSKVVQALSKLGMICS